jgi:hypothetical protein
MSYHLTPVVGANLSFPDALGISVKGELKVRNQWLVGIVNAYAIPHL